MNNFILHAARQEAQAGIWVDSGGLLGPTKLSHQGWVALDETGRAMLVTVASSGAYISATQGGSGGSWSPFGVVVNVQSISMVSDLASDNASDVTMVYETIGLTTSPAMAVIGAISQNSWTAPMILSGSDTNVSQIYIAMAPSGRVLAARLSSSPAPEIHAATRSSASAMWSSPATVSAVRKQRNFAGGRCCEFRGTGYRDLFRL